MTRFGEAVRTARESRGWTQQELATRVGVSQRAVSSWESLVSEPRDATKRAVADVLHLPSAVVPQDGKRPESGSPQLSELPFENLEPGEFEDFTYSLARALYPDAEPYRQGKSGHTQYGFDVVVEADGNIIVGIQCKRVQEFGPKEVEKAIDAAKEKVGMAIIFLSRSASPDARAAVRTHRGWQLWDKNKISQKVHELDLSLSVPLVDRYFPLLRERFLRVPLPGPWLDAQEYYSRTSHSERYSHRWPLVGRQRLLTDLVQFAAGPAGRVGVLVGPGGAGKTKMLHALHENLPSRDLKIRLLEREPTIDQRSFEQLPPGRLLVIIDDAHDEGAPVGKVVAGVLAANPDANVLLSLRPDGELRARQHLRDANVNSEDVVRWQLDELQLQDAEALARAVLGAQRAGAAPRLAAVARDSPFLLVAGATLVRQGAVELRRFESDDRLRRELIETLVDTIPSGSTDQPEVRKEVLNAVAALQPVRTSDGNFRAALETLTKRAFDQVVPHLLALEDTGILLRRGDAYRVVPDLLGDALLARAAFVRATGTPTGYIERVHESARGQAMANLLVNASRIDWQETAAHRSQLTASLWEAVRAEFQAGDSEKRAELLAVLAKVAFYQPQSALDIARWALENPTSPADVEAGFGLTYTVTVQEVCDAAALVVRNAAYDPEILREAADLLWELGRKDARATNQHPNHALRLLADIASYQRRGITVYQQMLPAIVERWLRRQHPDPDVHDPLTVLHPLLAADGHDQTWSGDTLTFHHFLINPDATPVDELRKQVLDLAFEQLASADVRRAAVAAETIGMGLTGPRSGFGREVTDSERAPWTKYFRQTLTRLRDAIIARNLAAAVSVALRVQLQWAAEHASSEILQASRNVLAALPSAPEYELARALHGGPIDPPSDPTAPLDYMDRHRAHEQFMSRCAAAVSDWPDARVIGLIEQSLVDLRHALGDDEGRARPFVWSLTVARPALGEALCQRVQETPTGPLTSLVSTVMAALAQADSSRVVELAQRLLDNGDITLARQIAHGFGIQRSRTGILDGEPALLLRLVEYSDPDGIVPGAAVGAVRFLTAEHQALAVELLTHLPAEGKDFGITEFASRFGPRGTLSWRDLDKRHRDAYLEVLSATPSLENYEITEFLAMLSFEDPHRVIDVLTARVEAVEAGSLSPASAVPHSWSINLRFREHEGFPDLLRRVREWLAVDPDSLWRHHLGSELFAKIAGGFDAQTRQIIDEYLDEPDPAKVKVVATMLRCAPRSLVWETDFVRNCLRAADACGPKSLDSIQAALYSTMLAGGRWTEAGQPDPLDVDQRDTASRLATEAVRGSVEEHFYRGLSQAAESWIERSTSEIDIPDDGRYWRHR